MNRYEIDKQLSSLYRELEQVKMANELTACILCNTDTKQEAIEAIQQEIDYYEGQLKEIEEYENRETNYERTADKPYLCW
jgi:hypothetical protein